MEGPSHLDILRKGHVKDWNDWREQNPSIWPDLTKADLQEANLRGANLREAILREAILRGANLQEAMLQGATLLGAVLQEANLQGADLRGAGLQGAILQGAILYEAILREANLQGANAADHQLDHAWTLRGATMRNGRQYEDWLKDKEQRGEHLTDRQKADLERYDEYLRKLKEEPKEDRGEAGENGGPS
jgi:uncharacterized protein YjbI with pentapeptide repeats